MIIEIICTSGPEGNGNGSGINGRTLQGDISLGVGMDINLADNLKLSLESTYMGTGSDKLDAFVGSTNKNDVLQYTSIGVGYNFDIKKYRSGKKTSSNEASTSWKARKMTETAAKTQKAEKETQQTEAKEKKGASFRKRLTRGVVQSMLFVGHQNRYMETKNLSFPSSLIKQIYKVRLK